VFESFFFAYFKFLFIVKIFFIIAFCLEGFIKILSPTFTFPLAIVPQNPLKLFFPLLTN
jgi:hypothetical protein